MFFKNIKSLYIIFLGLILICIILYVYLKNKRLKNDIETMSYKILEHEKLLSSFKNDMDNTKEIYMENEIYNDKNIPIVNKVKKNVRITPELKVIPPPNDFKNYDKQECLFVQNPNNHKSEYVNLANNNIQKNINEPDITLKNDDTNKKQNIEESTENVKTSNLEDEEVLLNQISSEIDALD
jgi:cbb3-type cytochrome oxidase subunit 3